MENNINTIGSWWTMNLVTPL